MRESGKLGVLIADDHLLFVEALEAILEQDGGLVVLGRAHDGEGAVRLAEELDPDIVLMDISMPGMDGLAAAEHIRDRGLTSCVLVLTGSNDPADVARARAAGASGYVTKDRIGPDLVGAVYAAAGRRGTLS